MSSAPSLQAIGQRIKKARWDKSWTMKTLADNADISDSTLIGYIENGSVKVSDATLDKIAKALGVTLEYLQTGVIPETPKAPILTSEKQLQYLLNHFPAEQGDTIWYKDFSTGNIIPFTVKDYICEVKCVNEATGVHLAFDIRNLGKNLFLSKKEAENAPEKL